MTRDQRIAALKREAKQRILILDGAMGTMIQRYKLDEAGYRGTRFKDHPRDLKGNNDLLVLTQPKIIAEIHDAYLEAGADIVETNTFNAQAISQSDYGLEDIALEMNVAAAKLAREAADAWTKQTPNRPRFVAGAIGPTNRTASISPDVNNPGFRNVSFDELVDAYATQTRGLIEGGADTILIETVFDTLNAKAAGYAVEQVFDELGVELVGAQSLRADPRGVLVLDAAPCALLHRHELLVRRRAAPPCGGRDCPRRRHARQRLSQCRAAQRDGRL